MKKLATALVLLVAVSALSAGFAVADGLPLPWPPQQITVTPSSYDFGYVPVFSIASKALLLTNPNPYPLDFTTSTGGPFMAGTSSFTIAANSSRRLMVYFMPQATGPQSGYVKMSAMNGMVKTQVPLSGTGY